MVLFSKLGVEVGTYYSSFREIIETDLLTRPLRIHVWDSLSLHGKGDLDSDLFYFRVLHYGEIFSDSDLHLVTSHKFHKVDCFIFPGHTTRS